MTSWTEIGEKWNRAQQMGWQAVQAAIEVGEDLQEMKLGTSQKEFVQRVGQIGMGKQSAYNLMRLALHRDLIEAHRPDSMRGALALLPKVPTKTSEQQWQAHRSEVDKFEEFAKKTAKEQAEILFRKKVKVELERLQNQAHEAILTELKAVKSQLEKERKRLGEVMDEYNEKREFYGDLLSKRLNGFDVKAGIKTLRQALHPDREEITPQLREKAMHVVDRIAKIWGV